LQARNLEPLAAPNVLATDHIISAHHVRLCLGESGPVSLVCPARQLIFFAPYQPSYLIFFGLAAMWAGQRVLSLFRFLVEEVPFFHGLETRFPGERKNSSAEIYRSIPYLDSDSITAGLEEDRFMAKRKRRPEKFSVVKAVKANARERVGQPRPERVIEDPKRAQRRKPKHPQTLPQLLTGE
jgi:hypothetical protein